MGKSNLKFQTVIDMEVDRLARLTECELMKLRTTNKVINFEGTDYTVSIIINDWGTERHIVVITEQKTLLSRQRFINGLTVKCSMTRMSEEQLSTYD